MTLLQKLIKADTKNAVTTKKGELKARARDSITAFRNDKIKHRFYFYYTIGSGRWSRYALNEDILIILRLLKFKYTINNSSPRDAKIGLHAQVSKSTYQKIINLTN